MKHVVSTFFIVLISVNICVAQTRKFNSDKKNNKAIVKKNKLVKSARVNNATINSSDTKAEGHYIVKPVTEKPASEMIYYLVDKEPEFFGGEDSLLNYLITNCQYPQAAKKEGVTGKIFTEFVIRTDGTVTDINPYSPSQQILGYGCEAEVIRLLNSMPKWQPGLLNGKIVSTTCELIIQFSKEGTQSVRKKTVTYPDFIAEFPGKNESFKFYLEENLNFPVKIVTVRDDYDLRANFIITKAGKITDIEISTSAGIKKDNELTRVIKNMPLWKPAMVNNILVNTYGAVCLKF
jgi:Gram-negative bacterial TonB protein C-terminal